MKIGLWPRFALFTAASTACAQPSITLVSEGRSDYSIVVARDAPAPVLRGARELEEHLARMSGARLPIVTDEGAPPEHAVFVGTRRDGPVDDGRLGEDGFALRTSGSSLIVAGPGRRGTMYGCSTLLEMLGVRWLTPRVTVIPHRATITLNAVDTIQVPAFEYREPFFTEAFDKDWAARNKVVGHFAHLDESTGGKIEYSDFVHTFDTLVPPALFEQHPEYFPLIGGKRVSGYVQRCLTNPGVLKLAIAGVKRSFQEHPRAVICSVSQNDCASWCECDECRKITDRYGAHSGLYLWYVNQVAEAIEKELPGRLIDTLAYQFTEKPPTGIVPLRNVRVRLCPISVCEAHPYERDDFPATKAFVANLAAWGRITDTLYIWHYNTDFAHYLMPFPDFDEFPADARLYQRLGVKGIFFQGDSAPGGGGSDAELRSFVMAKLLWDPGVDTDALVTEWMQGVYGAAWRPMRRWFDLLHRQARNPANHLGIYDGPGAGIFSAEVLDEGETLIDEAAGLAGTTLEKEYVERARLSVRYVRLVQGPRTDNALAEFLADARKFGITSLREGQGLDDWEKEYRAKAASK